ncbi:MAG: hypothetical protein JNL68_18610 [Burkholderiales bacterium]|nr:hypothetical protein [Burkholderiales bacterium]
MLVTLAIFVYLLVALFPQPYTSTALAAKRRRNYGRQTLDQFERGQHQADVAARSG